MSVCVHECVCVRACVRACVRVVCMRVCRVADGAGPAAYTCKVEYPIPNLSCIPIAHLLHLYDCVYVFVYVLVWLACVCSALVFPSP